MKIKFIVLTMLFAQTAFSQIKLPQVSGAAEVEQTIGYTKMEVTYARPNLNNRTAFGGELVPFGKLWRTGANTNTIVELSTDISIENKPLEKGTYAIFTIPNAKSWDVIFYKKTDNWGAPEKLDESLIALKISVPVLKTTDKLETFTIGFKNAYIDNAQLYMAWENTMIQMHVKAKTFEMAEAIIKNELNEKASAYDYFGASYYYYSNKLDMNKALEWINIAIKKDSKTPFFKEYKSKIEAALKKKGN